MIFCVARLGHKSAHCLTPHSKPIDFLGYPWIIKICEQPGQGILVKTYGQAGDLDKVLAAWDEMEELRKNPCRCR